MRARLCLCVCLFVTEIHANRSPLLFAFKFYGGIRVQTTIRCPYGAIQLDPTDALCRLQAQSRGRNKRALQERTWSSHAQHSIQQEKRLVINTGVCQEPTTRNVYKVEGHKSKKLANKWQASVRVEAIL